MARGYRKFGQTGRFKILRYIAIASLMLGIIAAGGGCKRVLKAIAGAGGGFAADKAIDALLDAAQQQSVEPGMYRWYEVTVGSNGELAIGFEHLSGPNLDVALIPSVNGQHLENRDFQNRIAAGSRLGLTDDFMSGTFTVKPGKYTVVVDNSYFGTAPSYSGTGRYKIAIKG